MNPIDKNKTTLFQHELVSNSKEVPQNSQLSSLAQNVLSNTAVSDTAILSSDLIAKVNISNKKNEESAEMPTLDPKKLIEDEKFLEKLYQYSKGMLAEKPSGCVWYSVPPNEGGTELFNQFPNSLKFKKNKTSERYYIQKWDKTNSDEINFNLTLTRIKELEEARKNKVFSDTGEEAQSGHLIALKKDSFSQDELEKLVEALQENPAVHTLIFDGKLPDSLPFNLPENFVIINGAFSNETSSNSIAALFNDLQLCKAKPLEDNKDKSILLIELAQRLHNEKINFWIHPSQFKKKFLLADGPRAIGLVPVMESRGKKCLINAGAAHGITKDTLFAVYEPGDTTKKPVAFMKPIQNGSEWMTTELEVVAGSTPKEVLVNCKIFIVSPELCNETIEQVTLEKIHLTVRDNIFNSAFSSLSALSISNTSISKDENGECVEAIVVPLNEDEIKSGEPQEFTSISEAKKVAGAKVYPYKPHMEIKISKNNRVFLVVKNNSAFDRSAIDVLFGHTGKYIDASLPVSSLKKLPGLHENVEESKIEQDLRLYECQNVAQILNTNQKVSMALVCAQSKISNQEREYFVGDEFNFQFIKLNVPRYDYQLQGKRGDNTAKNDFECTASMVHFVSEEQQNIQLWDGKSSLFQETK